MATTATALDELKKGVPGRRFQRLYKRRHGSRHGSAKNAAFIALGTLTMTLGVLTYPIPVIPSDVIILLGIALFAQGSKTGATFLDWLEVRFHRRFPGAIEWWKRLPRRTKLFISVAWPTTVGTLFYIIRFLAGE
jgi:uncharacterized membrane protein YbaN (DUF454 family)